MSKYLISSLALLFAFVSGSAHSFCGFYVAKADTKLFNRASKVVMMRDKDRTVITMANDYQGDLKEFAIVIPVPTVLQKEQVHVTNRAIIDHLDAYTSPRLVEYFDRNPCRVRYPKMAMPAAKSARQESADRYKRAKSLGVKIEAEYTVGEYDILILSAKQSNGLTIWLKENKYRLPKGAERVLGSYIKQDMKFFVAKVNLKKQSKLGFSYLRPIQVAFESPKFMLPIRLGTLNANGDQELFVFALTRTGRVETTNYRTVKLPSNLEVPVYIKKEFGKFYKDMFTTQVERESKRAVFLEYAWDMGWCDPCAANPLSNKELRELGVYWLDEKSKPDPRPWRRRIKAKNVYVTRLHLRYNAQTFPDDLRFQETGNRRNFQGRYIIRHAWKGKQECPELKRYYHRLQKRRERQAKTLANLTGWDINAIRTKIEQTEGVVPVAAVDDVPWWRKIWQ